MKSSASEPGLSDFVSAFVHKLYTMLSNVRYHKMSLLLCCDVYPQVRL